MEDLRMAAIAQVTVMDAQELVQELERLRMAYAKQLGAMSHILKAFNDLYIELAGKKQDRDFLRQQIWRAEREAATQRIPSWFWRMSTDDTIDAVKKRVRWLCEEFPDITPDDIWANLHDAMSYSGIHCEDCVISQAIMEVINESTT